jgi:hypothetical protein
MGLVKLRPAAIDLDKSIGLTKGKIIAISSEYPNSQTKHGLRRGKKSSWVVPPRTAKILNIKPEGPSQ